MSVADSGQLTPVRLAELFRGFLREHASGVLDLQADSDQRRVFLLGGEIRGAISNQPESRLGQYLKRRGLVSEEQVSHALLLRSQGLRIGPALLKDGAIDATHLEAEIRRLAAEIILGAFAWPEGLWRFTPNQRPAPADVLTTLSTPQLLLEASRRLPEEPPASLFQKREVPLRLGADALEQLQHVSLLLGETKVIQALVASNTLGKLEAANLLEPKLLRRFLFGLHLIDALDLGEEEAPKGPPAAKPTRESGRVTVPTQPTVGSLAKSPLADLFRWISRERLSGTLDLQNGGEQRRIHFLDGEVKSALSSAASSRLGQHLKSAGLVREEQVQAALARRSEGVRFGRALVEAKAISAEALDRELRKLVTDIVAEAFPWKSGNFRFTPTTTPVSSDVMISISTANLLLVAARRIASDEVVAAAIGAVDTPLAFAADPLARLQHITLSPAEGALLGSINGKSSIADLRKLGYIPSPQVDRFVLGLLAAGILEYPERAGESPFGGAAPTTSVKVETERRTTKLLKPVIVVSEETMKEELSYRRRKIQEIHRKLSRMSAIDLLEVAPNATFRDIRWNYNMLMEMYHPDNAFKPEYADLKNELLAISRELTKAYRSMAARFGKDTIDGE